MEPVQLLLNAGANPNIQNKAGESPLHWAALFDFPSIALELWHFGGKEDLPDIDGDTPMKIRAMQLKQPRRLPLGQPSAALGVPSDLPPNTGSFQCRLCKNTFPLAQANELKGNKFDKDCYDKLMNAQKDRATSPPPPAAAPVKDIGSGSGKYVPNIPAAKGGPPAPPPKKK